MKDSDYLLSATTVGVVFLHLRESDTIGAIMLGVILLIFWIGRWAKSYRAKMETVSHD